MNGLRIYPGRELVFQKELEKLESSEEVSDANKEVIKKFQNHLFSIGTCGPLRVSKLSIQLRKICFVLKELGVDRNLDGLTKDDVTALIGDYNNNQKYSEATKSDYRRVIKQFYKWFKDEDTRLESDDKEIRTKAQKFYKFIEKDIKVNGKKMEIDASTVITDEDCNIVIEKGCKKAREKAFVSLLHETGCRIGEFLNIRLKNIKIKENYMEIEVDGKTGRRVIPIVKVLPYLLRYIDVHPSKEDKDSYLWLSEAQMNLNEPLNHSGARKLLDRCFKRAGIKKRHNPHWFRHSRASLLAPKLTEAILCKFMGWELGSRQIKTYSHLSIKQLSDVVLTIHGVKAKEDETEKPLKCICGTLNGPNERYCFKCYKPLKVETVIQDKELIDSEINKTIQFMMELTKNPELMKAFEKFRSFKQKGNV